jgi:hypothetical protein
MFEAALLRRNLSFHFFHLLPWKKYTLKHENIFSFYFLSAPEPDADPEWLAPDRDPTFEMFRLWIGTAKVSAPAGSGSTAGHPLLLVF